MSSRLERAREAQRKVDLAFALRNAHKPDLPVSSGVPQTANPVASTDPHTAVPLLSEQCTPDVEPNPSTAHRAVAQNHNPSPSLRTEAQQHASRENGAKSSGPVTDAGKAASSKNALKHGLCSANLRNLPPDVRAEVLAEVELLCRSHKPQNHSEQRLVEIAALSAVRFLRLETAERAIAQSRVRKARRAWSEERQADVRRLLESLRKSSDNAEETRRALVATTHGCRALARVLRAEARRLELPDSRFDRGLPLRACGLPYEPLHPDDLDGRLLTFWRAVYAMEDSSGIALAKNRTHPALWMRLTQDAPSLEAARADVIAFLYEQSGALMIRSRNVWRSVDRAERREATDRAMFDQSPEAKLLARYMNDAARTHRQSISALIAMQKHRERQAKDAAADYATTPARNEPTAAETYTRSTFISETSPAIEPASLAPCAETEGASAVPLPTAVEIPDPMPPPS
jgi:hypothetical protein